MRLEIELLRIAKFRFRIHYFLKKKVHQHKTWQETYFTTNLHQRIKGEIWDFCRIISLISIMLFSEVPSSIIPFLIYKFFFANIYYFICIFFRYFTLCFLLYLYPSPVYTYIYIYNICYIYIVLYLSLGLVLYSHHLLLIRYFIYFLFDYFIILSFL